MDYAGRRADDPAAAAAAPHHAAYAAAHHLPTTNPNPTPLHQHPYHLNHNPQIQSHYSQYYPNPNPSSAPSYPSSNPSSAPTYPSSNPSSAAGPNFDGNPTAAAPPGAEPYLPNPYHGGYEGLRRAATTAADGPPAVDPHMPDPYAAYGGYGAPPAPSAAAADGPPLGDPYAAHGGYGGLPAHDPYAAHGSYGSHLAPAGSMVPSNVTEPYVPNSFLPPQGAYDGVHGDAVRYPYLGFGSAGSGLYHYGGGGGSASNQLPEHWSNIIHPNSKDAIRKNVKKTTKVVQAVRCQVCKIECTNKDGLDIHKQGKKHKKNLLKLQETITAKQVCKIECTNKDALDIHKQGKKHKKNLLKLQETITAKPVDEGDATANKQKKKARASAEDFEAKRKRVLEAGAAAGEIKECKICNVIVNSQKVFDFHIRGQMHIAMVKQHATTV